MPELRTIVRQEVASWRSALGSVSGVYVITDVQNGKQYVGSAWGAGGVWGRWCAYARSGHGGSKELRTLLAKRGAKYARHFQFAVLEVCDINASKEHVISREAHWKEVLQTRPFGYNSN